MRRHLTRDFVLIGLCILCGCAETPPRTAVPIEERGRAHPESPVDREAPASGGSFAPPEAAPHPAAPLSYSRPADTIAPVISRVAAVQSLATQAAGLATGGDLALAAATIERALRIEPSNPWLWHRLAAVHLERGDTELARASAQRSNLLAPEAGEVRRANAALLERIAAGRREW